MGTNRFNLAMSGGLHQCMPTDLNTKTRGIKQAWWVTGRMQCFQEQVDGLKLQKKISPYTTLVWTLMRFNPIGMESASLLD